jgi:hypothetical protein
MPANRIPLVLRIDVEPDEHQPPGGERAWDGFITMSSVIERVRPCLEDRSGRPVNPTWFVRFDPDIRRAFGRLDFALHRHREQFDRILKNEDELGIHVHALRWNDATSTCYTDYADTRWTEECVRTSVDAFTDCFRYKPRHASQGGYFMSEALVDVMVQLGIECDVTIEPGLEAKAIDSSFGTHATGLSGDFVDAFRQPFYPSNVRFDRPAESYGAARRILMVPLTSYDYTTALVPWFRRWLPSELKRPKGHQPLNPWKRWPSPAVFWDLAERAADSQPGRYLAFAFRTERRGTAMEERTTAILDYLPHHPIARRLSIVPPLSPEIVRLAVPAP